MKSRACIHRKSGKFTGMEDRRIPILWQENCICVRHRSGIWKISPFVWSIGKNYIKKYKKKICAIFCKKVIEQQGREIVSEQGKEEVNLVCYHVYEPGDQILLEAVTAENPPVSDDIPLTGGFFCSDLFISPAVSEYFPYCPRRRW